MNAPADIRQDPRQDTIAAILVMHELRVTELITHANKLEEKMRAEKRRADAAEEALLALARVAGELAIIKLREAT